jgi:hypothetical protein
MNIKSHKELRRVIIDHLKENRILLRDRSCVKRKGGTVFSVQEGEARYLNRMGSSGQFDHIFLRSIAIKFNVPIHVYLVVGGSSLPKMLHVYHPYKCDDAIKPVEIVMINRRKFERLLDEDEVDEVDKAVEAVEYGCNESEEVCFFLTFRSLNQQSHLFLLRSSSLRLMSLI